MSLLSLVLTQCLPHNRWSWAMGSGTLGFKFHICHFQAILLFILFYFLAALCSMWDLSSLTRDQTHAPCSGSTES